MEFYAENASIEPLEKFQKLNEISQPPFAVLKTTSIFYSASPERYLKRKGNFFSQPIKGTMKRFSDLGRR
jgi:para-aminobenzoate synthetase component 1